MAVEALANVMSRASEVTQAVGQMVLELLSDLLETGTFVDKTPFIMPA